MSIYDNILNRRKFLYLTGMGTAGLLVKGTRTGISLHSNTAARQNSKPNFIIIFVDDLGYADLGCQGGTDILTPYIDSLAANGTRLTSGYVSAPVCSPSRAGLITGRYQQRFGHEFNPGPEVDASPNFGLPLTEVTLADRLKSQGYATGLIGKYHLGYKEEFHPLKRGFDEFFGFLGGGHNYFPWTSENSSIMRGTELVEVNDYLTDAFTREAVDFIQDHHDHPFFLFLSYNAVHSPLQANMKYIQRFPHITDPDRKIFAAMLSAVDDGVGAVIKKLQDLGIENNTMIFFLSDNGGPTPQTTSKNDPLRGYKGDVWEGGIRIPFLIQWKGHLPAGLVYDHPIISLDILATALSAAGEYFEDDSIDGVDLLPFLKGESENAPHESLFWRYGNKFAIRKGQYKLVYDKSKDPELYDLDKDISETSNIASQRPYIVSHLKEELLQWNDELVDPLWYYASSIDRTRAKVPERYILHQNYPNPFNPYTVIRFEIPRQCRVNIDLFDITGRHVKTILDQRLNPGCHKITLKSKELSSGLYLYQLKTEDVLLTRKCMLLK